jgi:hypothetical protein
MDRFNLTGLNTEVQYYQYALDLVTDVFDLDCEDDMREQIEKSARHLYGLVHARYIVTTRGLQKMVSLTVTITSVITYTHPNATAARQIQERRIRQMSSSNVRRPKSSPHGPKRHTQCLRRKTLLRPLRGPVQPEINAARQHRRRLLWH